MAKELKDAEVVEAVEALNVIRGIAAAAAYGLPARRAAGFAPNLVMLPVLLLQSAVNDFLAKFYQDNP